LNTTSEILFLVDRLKVESEKTLAFFQSLAGEQWEQRIYTEGTQWTAQHVLAHFVLTENAILELIDVILSGGPGAPEGFDIDGFNESRIILLREVPPVELIERFAEARQTTITRVSQMTETDLARVGRHPALGLTPIEDFLKLLYRHNQIHQRDVRRAFLV
jgi:hypothetical protein